MKKMKKILAFVMAMAMVLGMGVTSFASNYTADKATVLGVEDETPAPTTENPNPTNPVKVYGYQIIKYSEEGKYVPVLEEASITKDGEGNLTPTAEDAAKLAARLTELAGKMDNKKPVEFVGQDDGSYTSGALTKAGTWLIVVTGSAKYLYNPAILSVRQGENGLVYPVLNLNTDSWGNTAYLKKSAPTITKEVKSQDAATVQYGDVLEFEVKSDIPSYTGKLESITYKVSDKLEGLKLVVNDTDKKAVITFEGVNADAADEVKAAVATLEGKAKAAIVNDATSFEIDFSNNADELQKLPVNTKMVIKYYAKVTTEAKLTVDETTNTAKLEYSTNNDTTTQKKEATTTHYTFGFDTKFSGDESKTTSEFVKIDKDGNIEEYLTNQTEAKPLADAWFQVHINSKDGKIFAGPGSLVDDTKGAYYKTDSNGRLEITGLDGDVNYYLVEIKAPTGYSIVEDAIKVKITPTYDKTTGILEGYSVTVGKENETGTVTNYGYSEKKTTVSGVQNPYGFKNTKLSSLPSTGGIGTTIFTIGGCAIMIVAAGLFFASRRKSSK